MILVSFGILRGFYRFSSFLFFNKNLLSYLKSQEIRSRKTAMLLIGFHDFITFDYKVPPLDQTSPNRAQTTR